jgi:hypothetical protein
LEEAEKYVILDMKIDLVRMGWIGRVQDFAQS